MLSYSFVKLQKFGKILSVKRKSDVLTFYAPTPQNGQTNLTICWLLPTNSLIVFDHFAGLVLKGLSLTLRLIIFAL